MMSVVMTILGMALLTYLPRLMGFMLSGRRVSPFWLRFLHFIPLTVFAAIIVPAVPGSSGEAGIRVIAGIVAGFMLWRFKYLWLGILSGMVVLWILRLL